MMDLGFVALLVVWSAGLGGVLLRGLGVSFTNRADQLSLAVPLGFGALALGVLCLGTLGWMNTSAIVAFLGVGLVILLLGRDRSARDNARLEPDSPVGIGEVQGRALDLAFGVALLAGLIGTLAQAMVPATDGDALCYHLQVPKVFLANGAASFEPDLHETVYPLVVELLYAVGLTLRGTVACRLIQWTLGLVFALNVAAIARPVLGRRSWWAGAIALLVPAVTNGMSAPLNDVALAAFANAALHAALIWGARPSLRSAILAGICGGLAIGVKYPALPWIGLIGVGMTLHVGIFLVRRHRGEQVGGPRPAHVLVFGLTVLAVGGWWYLRAYQATGNPVFPFFHQVFGSGLDVVLDPSWRPLAVTLPNLLTALVPMTLQPDRFDSLAHQFGPVFLLILPALLLTRPPRRVALVVAFGFTFLTLCLTQRQSMRFFLAALGPFSVGVAWLGSEWLRRGVAGRVLTAILAMALLAEGGLALTRPRHALPYLTGRESAEAYLARVEPTWNVGRWIDQNLPANSRLVGQDHRGFYIPRPYAMELAHRRRTGLTSAGESPEQIVATLRERGFTHLLLCPPDPEGAVEFDPTLGRRLAPWLIGRRPLYREDLPDGDGVSRRYAIYALDDAPRVAAGPGGGPPR